MLAFFVKTNDLLRRGKDIESVTIANAELLSRIANAPVSIVLRQTRKAYGHPCQVHILEKQGPVLSLFFWQEHPAFFITDGIIVIWSRICAPVPLATAVSQIDIIIHSCILQENLRRLAITDGLTGLYNRKYFMEALAGLIQAGNNPGLLLLDIDHFKGYNDSFGHPEGDIVLSKTGALLKRMHRSSDIPGRCGGEEFGVIIPDCTDLGTVAEKICRAFEQELRPPVVKKQVTCSIGGSQCPADGADAEQLYRVADSRLYQAKDEGRNRVIFTKGGGER